MAGKKIIAVLGATGAQGGGLVRAIQNDAAGCFTARALTRNVNSDKARALAELGAEVVAVDIDDIESLKKAFEGAYGAFCVTFFFEHCSPEKETAQAAAMAHAAKHAGLQHVVWSTLEDTRQWVPLHNKVMPTLMGRYKVPHLDAKGEANHVFTDLGVPTTFLLASFYFENFIYFGMGPRRGPDGTLAVTLPIGDKKLSSIAAEDIGKCVYGIFRRGRELIGKTTGIAGEHLTGAEIAATFTRVLGREVRFNDITPERYSLGFTGAEEIGKDLANMFQFMRDFNEAYCRARNVEFARALNPSLQNFEEWLSRHKSSIPLSQP